MSKAIERDIYTDQGTTFKEHYYAKINENTPLDISQYDIRMDISRSRSAPVPLISLRLGASTIPNPNGEGDILASNGITITDGPEGHFVVEIRPDQTAGIGFSGDELELVYDIEIQPHGELVVLKPYTGTFTIRKEVTKVVYT